MEAIARACTQQGPIEGLEGSIYSGPHIEFLGKAEGAMAMASTMLHTFCYVVEQQRQKEKLVLRIFVVCSS